MYLVFLKSAFYKKRETYILASKIQLTDIVVEFGLVAKK